MDPNVTTPQSEPDQDNSSLQNPSTNAAEAGTTDETRDDDHETSSIEALNWSEVEEDELAAAQQAEALAAAAALAGKENIPASSETKVNGSEKGNDDEKTEGNGSSVNGSSGVVVNDEGNVLSTSLLQSINSTVCDEDPQARKLSVIENWASEVTNAVERGEMEMGEDFPDEDGVTGDDENEGDDDAVSGGGVRKRKGKKLTPEMVASMESLGESSVDPLSTAPVLDDGPIWNKGPRSYTFQENRRINQKLTFCVLIAVVLAIGLGLGNLVAHQECEAEFKASQKSHTVNVNTKPMEKSPVPTTIPTTTPSPIIPDRSTDSSMMGSKLPTKQTLPSMESFEKDPDYDNDEDDLSKDFVEVESDKEESLPSPKEKPRNRRDEPIIDPKYRMHAETVSNVVHTLDRLSRKIDQFENTTRKLQGVLMIPDEEKSKGSETESSSLYDEEIHRDDDETFVEDLGMEEEDELPSADVDDLIDAIEQTPNYLEMKKDEEELKKSDEKWKEFRPSKMFDLDKILPAEMNREWKKMMKSFDQFREFQRRFIKSERKRLLDEGKYDRFKWRVPEQYTEEEKKALNNKFKFTWIEYIKLSRKNTPEPLDEIFGAEEEIEERSYGDVFYYPFPDPDDDAPEDLFRKNLEDLQAWEKENKHLLKEEETNIPDSSVQSNADTSAEQVDSTDDLIILEEGPKDTESPPKRNENESPPQPENLGSTGDGKSTNDQSQKHVASNSKPDPAQSDEILSTHDYKNISDEFNDNSEAARQNNLKMKRDTFAKSKNARHNKPATGNVGQNPPATSKSGKQKEREQKIKQSGKQKGGNKMGSGSNLSNSNNNLNSNSNAGGSSVKTKASGKSKKLKNLESNKVFENVKGKNFEKRRVTPEGTGAGATRRDSSTSQAEPNPNRNPSSNNNKSGKKVQRESTNDVRGNEKQRNFKQKQVLNNNQQQPQQNKYNPKPKYPDQRDKENRQHNGKEKTGSGTGNERAHLKYDNQDFASQETQYRQQKQEFNANRYNGKPPGGNKKSKNWQSKDKVERSRERTTSWGN